MPRRFRYGLIALTAAFSMLVSGCGDEPSGAQPDKDKSSGTTINITFKGKTVVPSGAEKNVKAGKPTTLHIVADKPGEIHVHSSPEQEIEYDAGTSDKKLTIDQPGVVEVESHTLDKLIVVLEVR
jgi:hypothetical protein